MDLREVGLLVGDVLHHHRRDHGVERSVGNRGHRVGGGDERHDPGEAGGHPGEPRGFQVDGVHRPGGVYQSLPREGCEERPVSASEVGKRERAGRQRAQEQRRESLDVEVDRGLGVALAHASEVTRRPAGSRPSRPRSSPL